MRELEQRERKIKEIQSTGDRLLREEHPGKQTVEVRLGARPGRIGAQWGARLASRSHDGCSS